MLIQKFILAEYDAVISKQNEFDELEDAPKLKRKTSNKTAVEEEEEEEFPIDEVEEGEIFDKIQKNLKNKRESKKKGPKV